MIDFETELRAAFAKKKSKKELTWHEKVARNGQRKRDEHQAKLKQVTGKLKELLKNRDRIKTAELYDACSRINVSYGALCKLFHQHMKSECEQGKAEKISQSGYRIIS